VEGKDASAMLVVTPVQQGQVCQRNKGNNKLNFEQCPDKQVTTLGMVMQPCMTTVHYRSQQCLQTGKAFGISGPDDVDDDDDATR
jgi:hypothetical protein